MLEIKIATSAFFSKFSPKNYKLEYSSVNKDVRSVLLFLFIKPFDIRTQCALTWSEDAYAQCMSKKGMSFIYIQIFIYI